MSRWLGLDIGEKRIGVAICDETHTLARPLLTITRASKIADFARIAALCGEHQIERIIAGLPKTLRNEEGLQARCVRRYAAALHAAVNLPIEFWDERFSSVDAGERLAISSRKPRRKGDIDAAAAAIILQGYLDSMKN
jgi:putative holliday junction resolvase